MPGADRMSEAHRGMIVINRSSPIERTARVQQLEGMFDVAAAARSEESWRVDLPLEAKPWNVGLIVGPSGCGKTTIARELFNGALAGDFAWSPTRSIVDGFPAGMGIREITLLLSSVGFSSPPSWLRPYAVLSTGQQFRVTMARALAEMSDLCVVDEFTSVVDRTVAQIGSCAIAKTVRRRKQKFVAVSCHYDIEAWLDPDWVFEPAENRFQWRLLRRRPPIELVIRRVHASAWELFAPHHYLTATINKSSVCYCAFLKDQPVAFHALLAFVGRLRTAQKAMRGSRCVVLPDFQGVGIGDALMTFDASIYAALGYRVFRPTGHPAEIASARHNPLWTMIRAPSRNNGGVRPDGKRFGHATDRITASFEYCGPPLALAAARALADR
jgi:energy-coupling factor transporter ATP-binding protein EcfA2